MLGQQAHALGRDVRSIVHEGAGAAAPRAPDDAGAGLAPAGVGGAPDAILGRQVEPIEGGDAPDVKAARCMQHALRMPGRA